MNMRRAKIEMHIFGVLRQPVRALVILAKAGTQPFGWLGGVVI
jgi:hypothetical protein